MVEEFMLLGNISVGERTLQEFPDCALLRRHPAPPPSNYDPIVKAARDRVSNNYVTYLKSILFYFILFYLLIFFSWWTSFFDEVRANILLCKILCLHVLIFCSFMNKAFTAKAVVVCDV